MRDSHDGLIFACRFRPDGTIVPLHWETITTAWRTPLSGEQDRPQDREGERVAGDGLVWLHFDRTSPEARQWLADRSGLAEHIQEALLAEETRPRATAIGDGTLLILRGVNLNPGRNPEDMVSLRMWVERGRVLSFRRRKLMAVADIRERAEAGAGPGTAGAFVATLAETLISRMANVIEDMDEELDRLEDAVAAAQAPHARETLAGLRRRAILLRRHIAPQREALLTLQAMDVIWLAPSDRARLRETVERTTRFVEELDAMRERAAVLQDEHASRVSEDINRRMYLLSLIAAIFLPLGLITSILGSNVGGLPWTQDPLGFWMLSGTLAVVAAALATAFRLLRWF